MATAAERGAPSALGPAPQKPRVRFGACAPAVPVVHRSRTVVRAELNHQLAFASMSQNNSVTSLFLYVGCDVAKASLALDPALLPKLPLVANDAKGHKQLIKALQALGVKEGRAPHVVLEATGGYEQAVVKALHGAAIRVSVGMAKRVRYHALGRGVRAKTDPIDAGKLSAYGRDVQPAPTLPLTATEEELREFARRRRQLVRLRNQETNRQEIALGKLVTKSVQSVVAHLSKEIKAI